MRPILEDPQFFDSDEDEQGPFHKAWEGLVNIAARDIGRQAGAASRHANPVARRVRESRAPTSLPSWRTDPPTRSSPRSRSRPRCSITLRDVATDVRCLLGEAARPRSSPTKNNRGGSAGAIVADPVVLQTLSARSLLRIGRSVFVNVCHATRGPSVRAAASAKRARGGCRAERGASMIFSAACECCDSSCGFVQIATVGRRGLVDSERQVVRLEEQLQYGGVRARDFVVPRCSPGTAASASPAGKRSARRPVAIDWCRRRLCCCRRRCPVGIPRALCIGR